MTDSADSLTTEKESKNHFRFINLWQSSEERRAKYWLVRTCGGSDSLAQRMRDWRLSKIERHFNLEETFNPHTKGYDRNMTLNSQSALLCREGA